MKNAEKEMSPRMKKVRSCLIFFAWVLGGIFVLIDGWYGEDFFLKTLISAVSAIAIAALVVIAVKEGAEFFRNIALPSVFGVLNKQAGLKVRSKNLEETGDL